MLRVQQGEEYIDQAILTELLGGDDSYTIPPRLNVVDATTGSISPEILPIDPVDASTTFNLGGIGYQKRGIIAGIERG